MLIPINEIRVMVHSCDKGSQLAKMNHLEISFLQTIHVCCKFIGKNDLVHRLTNIVE